jgi:hypothetical protein
MHPLQQPILGLGLSPESANSLAAIGDDFKEGCASLLLLVRLVVAALLQSEAWPADAPSSRTASLNSKYLPPHAIADTARNYRNTSCAMELLHSLPQLITK